MTQADVVLSIRGIGTWDDAGKYIAVHFRREVDGIEECLALHPEQALWVAEQIKHAAVELATKERPVFSERVERGVAAKLFLHDAETTEQLFPLYSGWTNSWGRMERSRRHNVGAKLSRAEATVLYQLILATLADPKCWAKHARDFDVTAMLHGEHNNNLWSIAMRLPTAAAQNDARKRIGLAYLARRVSEWLAKTRDADDAIIAGRAKLKGSRG